MSTLLPLLFPTKIPHRLRLQRLQPPRNGRPKRAIITSRLQLQQNQNQSAYHQPHNQSQISSQIVNVPNLNLNEERPSLKGKPKPSLGRRGTMKMKMKAIFQLFPKMQIRTLSQTPVLLLLLILTVLNSPLGANANILPQFLLSDGQSEIVLRLKEGPATPVGSLIYTLKGLDRDGDPLTFGLKGQAANELLRIENRGRDSANLYLKKELDREVEDEYMIILTLNDGKLSEPVQQSMLLLVEDTNDNSPVFKPYQSTVKVVENGKVPMTIASLMAVDADEGPYGQVIYKLQVEDGDEGYFTLTTVNGQAIVKLVKPLDYERKFLHQIKVIAMDRAETESQINKAVASIVIQVTDIEDVGPAFVSVPPVTRIREDVPLNSLVLQVRAIDGDRGINNPIKYGLLNENELFGIDSDTGIVYTKAPLDRESARGGSYVLNIVATEQSKISPKPSVETTVVVNLLDIDDEKPKFKSNFYLGEITENSQEGVPVTFLGKAVPEVFDHDLGINGTFRLRTEGDGGVFEVTPGEGINHVSFLIRVKNPARLDYEKIKEFNFTLIAEDMNRGDKFSKVPISVRVIDANDNLPEFDRPIYEVFMNENSPPGTLITKVRATDKDSGIFGTPGIRFTSVSGSIANEVELDPLSGQLVVKLAENGTSSLDREMNPVYYLTVEAQDNAGRGNRNSVQVAVHLRDENDNEPIFLQSRYEARIFENDMEFVSPLRLQARDADLKGTPNSEIHYSLILPPNSPEPNLEINSTTGVVRVIKPFDFEKLTPSDPTFATNIKHLNYTVRAHDSGIPSQFSTSLLTLYVFDVNDNSPIFRRTLVNRTVREDLVGGSGIGKVEAFDLDSSSPFNQVFYRIESGAQDKFLIESETGLIRLTPGAQLDFNLKPNHVLEVIALDGGGRQSETPCIVNITLKDVNNKKPRFEFDLDDKDKREEEGRSISSSAEMSERFMAKVKENAEKGEVIFKLKASDPDSSALLRFSIDFNRSEARSEDGLILPTRRAGKRGFLDLSKYFLLDPVDGILRAGEVKLDREVMERVNLHVAVQDIASESGEQKAHASLLVLVQDENDNEPKFRADPYLAAVSENAQEGTKVLTVRADDPDKERVIRYWIPGVGKKFPMQIDPETGVIELKGKVDREMTDWVNFTVVAEDSGTSPGKREARVGVHVRVVDKNDNVPTFVDNLTNVSIPEDTPVGTVVARVLAKDVDSGNYGKITYLLDRKSSGGKFVIDSETGHIRVAEKLDREEQPLYTLVLQAWDNFQFGYASGESRNAFKQIVVKVTDINDSPPEFLTEDTKSSKECSSVTEFHEDVILTVRAKDRDDENTPNGQVKFKLKSGNELGLFKLVLGNNFAQVVPARSLKGFYGNYTLSVEAFDGGKPVNRVEKDYNICILDYNDNKPRFINPAQNFTIKVPENATIGSSIIQVRAVDSDIGQNGVVRYRFRQEVSRHYETFEINPTTGVLTLTKQLDREKQKVYYLRIEAYDLGTPTSLSSELDLTILVKNIDDFKPIFTQTEFITQFTENIPPAREQVQLPPTLDRDEEDDEETKKTAQVCYFLLPPVSHSFPNLVTSSSSSVNKSSPLDLFVLDPLTHILTTKARLDREKEKVHNLTVWATDNCHADLRKVHVSLLEKGSLLKVVVNVMDVNDNAPRFIAKTFTGGVSTSSDYGTEILTISATDADTEANAKLTYFIIPPITMSLSEGLSHLINNDNPLFSLDPKSGALALAFDPQPDMKGHFSLQVGVNDTTGLTDKAKALVYLLRDDQKVKFTVRMSPLEVRQEIDIFRRSLSNVTGAIVNSDANFKYHENRGDGSVDKTKTDFYVHLVHPTENVVLEAEEVLKLIDLNIEELDDLFKEFNVLDTQKSDLLQAGSGVLPTLLKGREETKNLVLVYATGTALFLALLLLVVISICFAQRSKYQRQLKAATTNAYGSSAAIIPPARTGNLPNTNVHSMEGSNPIWMQAYHNTWYKEDSISDGSEARDSLDDAAVPEHHHGRRTDSTSPPSSHMRSFLGSSGGVSGGSEKELCRRNDLNRTYHRNLIYGNRIESQASSGGSQCLILKKHLETTEL